MKLLGNSLARRTAVCAAAVLALAGLSLSSAAAAGDESAAGPVQVGTDFIPGEAIVRYERNADSQARRSARRAAGARFDAGLELPRAELLEVDGSVRDAVSTLAAQPGVAFAQPNYRYEALAAAPDDSFFGELWGLRGAASFGVDALPAWDSSRGAGVTVAVVDTGVDLTHPDLQPNLWANPGQGADGDGDGNGFEGDVHGYDFIDDDGDPDDFQFHGTHVAGTIAAVAGNGIGVAGVAPRARIMAVRVLDGSGSGSSASVAAGIAYAAREGARVINLSLGGPAEAGDHLMAFAMAEAGSREALIAVAAGNDGSDNDAFGTYPCNFRLPNSICVAAVAPGGGLAPFSNWGAETVDVGAPGVEVLSAKAEYEYVPGTGIEDFQSGDGGWSTGATLNGGIPWERVEDPKEAGNYVLTDSPGTNYANGPSGDIAGSELRRSPIDLSGQRGCRVHFRTRYEIEDRGPGGVLYDVFSVGALYGDDKLAAGGRYTGTSPEFGDAQRQMVRREAAINEADGRSGVEPRLAIEADEELNFDGAYVDNVSLLCRGETYVDEITTRARYDVPGDGSYVPFSGTSMATPHVAGVAALLFGALPGLSAPEAVAAIKAGGRTLGSLQGRTTSGRTLDAPGALAAARRGPTVSITARPAALGRDRRPGIAFSADRPSTFKCSLDGGAPVPCSSPFHPIAALTEGRHGFVVRATDALGRGTDSEMVGFEIDSRRPRVIVRKRPRKMIRTRTKRARVVMRFAASEPGVRFICRVDGGLPRFCGSPFVRRLPAGRHVVRVRARDAAGNMSVRNAVYRFTVKRIEKR